MGSYWGTSGNDTLMGEEGKDWIYGYSGDDSLSGGDGKDWLSGGEDNDSLSGENDKDWLIGDNGNDSLAGGDGNDSLVGGQGNDTLVGGQGSDRFAYRFAYTSSGTIFSPVNLGVDVISDFETGSDKIVLDKSLFTSISSTEGIGWSLIEEFATVTTDADAATSTADIIYNSVNGNLFYNANGSAPGLGTGSLLLTLTDAPTLVATDFFLDLTDLYFYGSQGDDSVPSGEGDDSLYAEEGNDSLYGGEGDDSLYGGEGNDSLIGGEGNDSLYDENGDDSLIGGEGNDSLYGGEGNDSLYGGEGNDSLYDGNGDDSLIGGEGNDSLYDGNGDDSLIGGEGNDSLYGGEGNDSLMGGEGSDQFVYSKLWWFDSNLVNFGVDVISDFETGNDKIVLDKSFFTSISSPVGTGLSNLEEFATVTTDADAATSSADIVYNSVNGNLFYNANGSDLGFGTGSLLLTLTGAPTLVVTDFIIEASPINLFGGTGDDFLMGGDVGDNLRGREGNDTLIGSEGNDELDGENGNDDLYGGGGNDDLYGGAGNDDLYGGAGNDDLHGGYGNGNDSLEGGYGNDSLSGSEGNDSLSGSEGDDSLEGGYGNDSLSGSEGDDSLDGEQGNDSLIGGEGDDFLIGSEGDDSLIGGQGSDRFIYSRSWWFNPNLVNFGVDVISDFETGIDKIVLDKSIFNSISSPVGTGLSFLEEFATVTTDADATTSTADIVYNLVNGNLFYNANGSDPGLGTGYLLLTLTSVPTLVATDFMIKASPVHLDGGNGDDFLVGGDVDDDLDGEEGNDSLTGGEGNDSLTGDNGNDSLTGEEGNDSLTGGEGNDSLTGGEGNDSLTGGEGNDSLTGGEGSDRFIYSTSSGVDVISDFETGNDKIVLYKTTFTSISSPVGEGLSDVGEFATVTTDADAATSSADIVYNSVNGNLFYNANGSDPGLGTGSLLLTLTGVPTLVATDFMIKVSPYALSLYGGKDNDFLEGGDGDDILNGEDGDDTLNGGDGKDSLEGGDGNDTLIGGQGSDYFRAVNGGVFGSEFSGVDVISDFETGSDTILLDKWAFSEISSYSTDVWLGFKVPEEFGIVTCDTQATISTAIIVYNSVNGNLFYNTNGSDPGLGTGSLFATLAGAPTLVVTDFLLTLPYKLE